MDSFERELQNLINRHSKENDSNTPDFILAKYISGCLSAFSIATRERDNWFGGRRSILDSEKGQQWVIPEKI